jgi:alanine dehydrogenase
MLQKSHYCITEIPGSYTKTNMQILSHATIKYVKFVADMGWHEAVKHDDAIYGGANVTGGFVTNEPVAKTHDIAYHELRDIIDQCPVYEVHS